MSCEYTQPIELRKIGIRPGSWEDQREDDTDDDEQAYRRNRALDAQVEAILADHRRKCDLQAL